MSRTSIPKIEHVFTVLFSHCCITLVLTISYLASSPTTTLKRMAVVVAKRYVCAHIPTLTAITSTFVSAKPHAHMRRRKKKSWGLWLL